jgi:glycerol-1-phosphate dehydrogenase [NAD(P)+]
MENRQITAALEKVSETRMIAIGEGEIAHVADVFMAAFGAEKAFVIADENTFAVAGKAVHQILADAGLTALDALVFPGKPALYANFENVLRVEEHLKNVDAIPVVVGSGTLNDLTKLASHHLGRPYMVVGTAASMDGYTASGASISKDGFKQTFACPAPRAVVADLNIISQAPARMTASGYGDLLGKIVAGADWMISDALGIEKIDPVTWAMVQDPLREATANPEQLSKGDMPAFKRLVEGLMLSGLTLQYYKSSRPASGAEHLISHLWEMQETTHGLVSHGLKVGFATIATGALFERLLDQKLEKLDIETRLKNWPTRDQLVQSIRDAHPDPVLSNAFIEQSLPKYVSGEAAKQRLELIRDGWPSLRDRMRNQLMTAHQLRDLLAAAGCITHPSGLDKNLSQLRESYFLAKQIRNRYTLLDLAADAGCLENCVGELFTPGGFWAEARQ